MGNQKFKAFILGFTLVGGLAIWAKSDKIVIKAASIIPKGTLWYNSLNKIAFKIRKKTNNKIRFKFFYGGVAGDERTIIRKARAGTLQMIVLTGIGMGMIVPELRLLEVPGVLRTNAQIDRVLRRSYSFFKRKYEKKGFVLVGMSEGGWVYLMSKKKIQSIQQLRGLKVWMPSGDKLVKTVMKELGIVPVPLGIESVMTQLQTGGLDAIYAPALAAVGYQWFREIKYVLNLQLVNLRGGTFLQKKFFDKLPKEFQKLLLDELKEEHFRMIPKIRRANQRAMKAILASGVKMVEPKPGEKEKLYKSGKNVIKRLKGKMFSGKTVKKILGMI